MATEKLFDRTTGEFRNIFSLTEADFTPEEVEQMSHLQKSIGSLNHQIGQLYNKELEIKKEVLKRKGLAATSLELLTTSKGEHFKGNIIPKPYPHVTKGTETAYFCEPCQLWTKGKPEEQIFINEGVAAYKCLVGDHPMGSGLFPFKM